MCRMGRTDGERVLPPCRPFFTRYQEKSAADAIHRQLDRERRNPSGPVRWSTMDQDRSDTVYGIGYSLGAVSNSEWWAPLRRPPTLLVHPHHRGQLARRWSQSYRDLPWPPAIRSSVGLNLPLLVRGMPWSEFCRSEDPRPERRLVGPHRERGSPLGAVVRSAELVDGRLTQRTFHESREGRSCGGCNLDGESLGLHHLHADWLGGP